MVTAVVTATPPASHRVQFLLCHGSQLLAFLQPWSFVFPAPSLGTPALSAFVGHFLTHSQNPCLGAPCHASILMRGRDQPGVTCCASVSLPPALFVFLAPRTPELSTPGRLTLKRSLAPALAAVTGNKRRGESVANRVGVAFSSLCKRRQKVGVFMAFRPPGTVCFFHPHKKSTQSLTFSFLSEIKNGKKIPSTFNLISGSREGLK